MLGSCILANCNFFMHVECMPDLALLCQLQDECTTAILFELSLCLGLNLCQLCNCCVRCPATIWSVLAKLQTGRAEGRLYFGINIPLSKTHFTPLQTLYTLLSAATQARPLAQPLNKSGRTTTDNN